MIKEYIYTTTAVKDCHIANWRSFYVLFIMISLYDNNTISHLVHHIALFLT